MFQKAGTQLAQVWPLCVELLLQSLHEGLLAAVDVLNVPEDGAQLLFTEHVLPLSALADIALGDGVGPRSLGTHLSTLPCATPPNQSTSPPGPTHPVLLIA